MQTRYGAGKHRRLGMYVEHLQEGSYPLLAKWHYYKCDELDEVDWNSLDKTKRLKTLAPEQVAFMRKSVETMRKEGMSSDQIRIRKERPSLQRC